MSLRKKKILWKDSLSLRISPSISPIRINYISRHRNIIDKSRNFKHSSSLAILAKFIGASLI